MKPTLLKNTVSEVIMTRKEYLKAYHKKEYQGRKNQKHACMMCGFMKCKGEPQICKSCKQTDIYQSEGYGSPCPIHS